MIDSWEFIKKSLAVPAVAIPPLTAKYIEVLGEIIGAAEADAEPLYKNPIPPDVKESPNALGFNKIVPISGRNQP